MTCDDYMDTCTVYVKPGSTTHRGCSKLLAGDSPPCPPQSVNCKQCDSNLCNGDVFPTNRLSCYHCDGVAANSECYGSLTTNSSVKSYPCETFNFRDSCYLYVDKDKLAYRGCLTDQNNVTEACQDDTTHCEICSSSNCNSLSVKREPKLSCMNCDSASRQECLWGLSETYAKACRNNVLFYANESCFTLSSTELGFAIRGCTLDTNVCSRAKCEYCSGDQCNRLSIYDQVCYNCTSEVDKNCWKEPFHTKNVTCRKDAHYDSRGCFTWSFENETIRRGCFHELSSNDRLNCLRDEKKCAHCDVEGNCNKIPINYAVRVGSTFSFNLLFLFIILILIAISCHQVIY